MIPCDLGFSMETTKLNRCSENMQPQDCLHCWKLGENFDLCAGCEAVYYCSKACQLANWPKHRFFCIAESKESTHLLLHQLKQEREAINQLILQSEQEMDPGDHFEADEEEDDSDDEDEEDEAKDREEEDHNEEEDDNEDEFEEDEYGHREGGGEEKEAEQEDKGEKE